MNAPRLLLVAALSLGLAPTSDAGWQSGWIPTRFSALVGSKKITVTGRLAGLRWVGRARPADAAPGPLVAPPGDWTDVVLIFDGPVTLAGLTDAGAPWAATLDLGELVVPLEDPDATGPLSLDLDLPAWLTDAAGRDIEPGHPRHDALVRAVRDGAIAR